MADCSKEGFEDMVLPGAGGPLVPDGTNEANGDNDSRRVAAHAEKHLSQITIVRSEPGEIEKRLADGTITTRSAIVLTIKIGDGDEEQWYELAYEVAEGKSDRLDSDDVLLAQLEKILSVPGRRTEMLELIRRRGTKIDG